MKETLTTILTRALQALRILLDIFWIGSFVIIAFAAAGMAIGMLSRLWVVGYTLIERIWPV